MLLSTDNGKLSRIHSFVEEQKIFAPHYLPPDEVPVSIIISDDAPSSGESLVLTSISQTSEKKKAKIRNQLPTTKSNGLHLLEVLYFFFLAFLKNHFRTFLRPIWRSIVSQ